MREPIHAAGFALALLTCLALLLFGLDPILTIALFTVWLGTLALAASKPPDPRKSNKPRPLSRDTMRDLIEYSGTPLLVIEQRRITIANRTARKLLGKHIIGQDARVAFRQPEAVALLNKHRSGTAILRGLVRRRDIWRMSMQQIDDNLAVVELINQTAEADISRAHTDFVANASHELRTPLASIIGYVETLRDSDEIETIPKSREFLDTIMREAKRLENLVSDLMSLSRVEAEKHDEPVENIVLGPLVERAAREAAGKDRIDRLRFDIASEVQIRGDTQQIEQLVRNLVDNALKYGAQEGSVAITLDPTETGFARLVFQDEGEGIAAEHIPHLTRRFYRTDPGRSRASGGTGLGLAIVKHIVERHRARLDIESAPGKGTRVTVQIPLLIEEKDGLS